MGKEEWTKVIGWALNLAVVVALAVGANFFSKLQEELKDLNKTLIELRVTVATTQEREAQSSKLLGELKTKVERLEDRSRITEGLLRRVEALEKK